jgi:hypothetical protein
MFNIGVGVNGKDTIISEIGDLECWRSASSTVWMTKLTAENDGDEQESGDLHCVCHTS